MQCLNEDICNVGNMEILLSETEDFCFNNNVNSKTSYQNNMIEGTNGKNNWQYQNDRYNSLVSANENMVIISQNRDTHLEVYGSNNFKTGNDDLCLNNDSLYQINPLSLDACRDTMLCMSNENNVRPNQLENYDMDVDIQNISQLNMEKTDDCSANIKGIDTSQLNLLGTNCVDKSFQNIQTSHLNVQKASELSGNIWLNQLEDKGMSILNVMTQETDQTRLSNDTFNIKYGHETISETGSEVVTNPSIVPPSLNQSIEEFLFGEEHVLIHSNTDAITCPVMKLGKEKNDFSHDLIESAFETAEFELSSLLNMADSPHDNGDSLTGTENLEFGDIRDDFLTSNLGNLLLDEELILQSNTVEPVLKNDGNLINEHMETGFEINSVNGDIFWNNSQQLEHDGLVTVNRQEMYDKLKDSTDFVSLNSHSKIEKSSENMKEPEIASMCYNYAMQNIDMNLTCDSPKDLSLVLNKTVHETLEKNDQIFEHQCYSVDVNKVVSEINNETTLLENINEVQPQTVQNFVTEEGEKPMQRTAHKNVIETLENVVNENRKIISNEGICERTTYINESEIILNMKSHGKRPITQEDLNKKDREVLQNINNRGNVPENLNVTNEITPQNKGCASKSKKNFFTHHIIIKEGRMIVHQNIDQETVFKSSEGLKQHLMPQGQEFRLSAHNSHDIIKRTRTTVECQGNDEIRRVTSRLETKDHLSHADNNIKDRLQNNVHSQRLRYARGTAYKENRNQSSCTKPTAFSQPCGMCDRTFNDKHSLFMHLLSHKGEEVYECDYCGRPFVNLYGMYEHISYHTGKEIYSCPYCGKVCVQNSDLSVHLSQHGVGNLLQCDICEKVFSEESILICHRSIHKSYLCEICGMIMYGMKFFVQHFWGHKGKILVDRTKEIVNEALQNSNSEKVILCDVCGLLFYSKSSFSTHQQLHSHNVREDYQKHSLFTDGSDELTRIMNDIFSSGEVAFVRLSPYTHRLTVRDYKASMKLLREKFKKQFKCSRCEKTFKAWSDFRRHLLVHVDVKPFSCSMCDKSFRRSHHLSEHLETHTKEKKYKCRLCEKSFAQQSGLYGHVQRHEKDKQYDCDICKQVFRSKPQLKSHIYSLHISKKKRMCSLCGKFFIWSANYYRHLSMHADNNVYQCETCNKVFSTERTLLVHKTRTLSHYLSSR